MPRWRRHRHHRLKGSAVNPNRIYASQSTGWFGQLIQRSDDGGQTWEPVGNEFAYAGTPGTHKWFDGTQHPWEFKRVWHLEPSLTDPETVYAGVEDAALFRSSDGGKNWQELAGLRDVKGHLWQPINRGLNTTNELPESNPEVGYCVHNPAIHPGRPDVLFMQKHWDVMRSDDAGGMWHEVTGGNEWQALTNGLPQSNCYVNILRDAMAVDSLDSCGIYFGTTGGQVYVSADSGDNWTAVVRDLPAVLSVEVQTLP